MAECPLVDRDRLALRLLRIADTYFQTSKRCIFLKKKLYMKCKLKQIHFFAFEIVNT